MGSPPDDATRLIGGRYRLLTKLGQGGMGTVWRAQDELLHRTIAIKEVDLSQVAPIDRTVMRERTLREARTAARLSHPNAVTVFDVVEEAGQPWIVMSLVVADSLDDVIRQRGTLTPQRTAEVGLALLSALEAAHKAGILHRDVKPSNVLIGHDGSVVLTDFGIATLEGDASLTSTGMLFGAPAYIAPERARGERPGPASDLWSLGATLYTAVEGRPPFERDSPMATLTALVSEALVPPRSAGPLRPALMALLDRDPRRRVDAPGARQLLQQAAGQPGEATRAMPDRVPTRALPGTAPPGTAPPGTAPPATAPPATAPHGARAAEPAWAGVPPPPPPVPGPGGARRFRTPLVLLLLVLALVAAAVGAVIYGGNRDQPGGTPRAVESPSNQPTPKASNSPTPQPSPSAAPLATTWPTLRQGDAGEQVRAAQYLLSHWGRVLTVDGIFGAAMRSEVHDYQLDHGLPTTDRVDATTWASLADSTERGDTHDSVKAVQVLLNAQGESLAVDGAFGAATERAVKEFQRAHGLAGDGVVSSQTWRQLLASTG